MCTEKILSLRHEYFGRSTIWSYLRAYRSKYNFLKYVWVCLGLFYIFYR